MTFPHRPHARTLLLITAGLALAAWLVPPYFHAGRYRHLLAAGLESKLGRPVDLGAVSFRLLPHPGFSIDNVVIREDPRFGSEPFARVSRVECDLRWRSLWGSRLDCARILLDHPAVNLVRNGRGEWNVEGFFRRSHTVARIRSARPETRSPSGFDLDVEDGRLNFTMGITKRPFAVTKLDGGLALDPSDGSIRFDFTGAPARLDLPPPTPGLIELSGEWKPGQELAGPLHATLHTSGTLLDGWIPLLTSRNLGMYGLVDATVQMDGSIDRLGIKGHIRLDQVHRWDSLPPSSSMPVDASFEGRFDRPGREIFIQRADASFASSRLHLSGVIDQIPASPELDLVLALQQSRLQSLLAMARRLSSRPPALDASGRVDGLLTIRGPWRERQYGGFVAVHALRLRTRAASFSIPEVGVRIDHRGAHLLPARFSPAPGVSCVVEGFLYSAPPAESRETPARSRERFRMGARIPLTRTMAGHRRPVPPRLAENRYELTFSTDQAPLHEFVWLARRLSVRGAREVDAEGWMRATLRLSGRAWPFTAPGVSAQADLHHARLLIPGLTEPVRLTRFHLEAHGEDILVRPMMARIGPATFSGWLRHQGGHENPWEFDASAPQLSLEQASLWFAVLGHKKPLPILDLIPGLRSLVARRNAGRNIFASLKARGRFESRLVTFRSVRLKDVRATLTIAGRVARVENATFRAGGGVGGGAAWIDFKKAPARITGKFNLLDAHLSNVAWHLPPALRKIQGGISATGDFTTRGLTRQEMSANLVGEADLNLRDVSFGAFDPLQALAHAASLGSFWPGPGRAHLPSAALSLHIHDQHVILQPLKVKLEGAVLDLNGDYGFDGKANVYIGANLSRVTRRWTHLAPNPFAAADAYPSLVLSAASGGDSLAAVAPLSRGRDSPARGGAEAPSLQYGKDPVAAVHLAGPVRGLALVRNVTARVHP